MADYNNLRISDNKSNALNGKVHWSPVKSIWFSSMLITTVVGGYLTFSWSAFTLFIGFTAFTLCFGHSLGMHRLLIHRSYQCPKWLEYFMVHLGVIVGLAGPKGMMQTHDMRDWAQRQSKCHDNFGHQQPFLRDSFWQIHCDIKLTNPPQFIAENSFQQDRVYRWMEKTWLLQQLPWALLFFFIGGIGWVVWGICARVAISILGHWLIGYFAHNKGHRHWHVKDAAIQGYNIKFASLITMGESWHNNHHAFPNSALLGINKGELDPGWWFLQLFKKVGLVSNIVTPETLPARKELQRIHP